MRKCKFKVHPIEIILVVMLFLTLVLAIITRSRTSHQHMAGEDIEEIVIDYSAIKTDDGHYSYEDENYNSSFGIDISEFQENVDWQKVKDAGVEFVFLRIGRRGATTGLLYDDTEFASHYEGARKVGLKVGVYFFSQAVSVKEAKEEADFVYDRLKGKKIDFPVVYDLEEVYLENETPRISGLSREEHTANALAFCERLNKKHYDTMIYTYLYWSDTYYDMEQISRYPIWFAQYDADVPTLDYPISIWQYSKTGMIDGISVPIDLNIMFIRK
ncbi:MAG: glycoside hydrolase family 25 protein [Erysipelotrichaceae bacterium]|nr:glycoside hydrolase family 25 protein [Erysipelotrichaceae bacterium]